jgi:hypothetical protein
VYACLLPVQPNLRGQTMIGFERDVFVLTEPQ